MGHDVSGAGSLGRLGGGLEGEDEGEEEDTDQDDEQGPETIEPGFCVTGRTHCGISFCSLSL